MIKISQLITLILILISQSCKNIPEAENTVNVDNSVKDMGMVETSSNCQNRFFPTEKNPVRNELIIFFNKKSCPTCIIDLKGYIDVIKNKSIIDAKFYTNVEKDELNGVDRIIPLIKIVTVDKLFTNLDSPIIFETNEDGRIFNCMPIQSSYLYKSYDYIKKYASEHPLQTN